MSFRDEESSAFFHTPTSDDDLRRFYRKRELNRYGLADSPWDGTARRVLGEAESPEPDGKWQAPYHRDEPQANEPPRIRAQDMRAFQNWASLSPEERDAKLYSSPGASSDDVSVVSHWMEDASNMRSDELLSRLRAYQEANARSNFH